MLENRAIVWGTRLSYTFGKKYTLWAPMKTLEGIKDVLKLYKYKANVRMAAALEDEAKQLRAEGNVVGAAALDDIACEVKRAARTFIVA